MVNEYCATAQKGLALASSQTYRGLLNFTFRPVFFRFFPGFCSGDEPMDACDAWRFRCPLATPLLDRDEGPSVSPSSRKLASARQAV